MDENMKEKSVKNTGINIDRDSLKNLANNLQKNQSSLDLGSLMQMATTLLKNDSLMNSVTQLSKKKNNTTLPESKITEKLEKVTNDNSVQNTGNNVDKDSLDLNSIMQLATTLTKNESLLNSVTEHLNATLPVSKISEKQENVELTSLSQKIENITNDISGLRQENAELASLSQKLE
ncbi:hypothetical protein, partial [Neobacillus drentensis]|uniref:hypothetical protein n=1 Tax=Neobacillus drentensis TaxID=220684 RepID=UPI003001EDFC